MDGGAPANAQITLATLADIAQVHVSTVSRALRASGEAARSNPRYAYIRQLAAELGYEPNPWARTLRTNQSRLLGLIIPRLTDGVLAKMFEAAEDEARRRGYQAVTVSTHDEPGEQGNLIRTLLERKVDGIILGTASQQDNDVETLNAKGVSFVLMNRFTGDYPAVHADDELGGYIATNHLISQGHSRIGFLSGPAGFSTSELRLAGFLRAHERAGLSVDPELVVHSGFSSEDGVRGAVRLLGHMSRPSALFAVNDSTAIGAMAVARDLGLRIPEDLAVVGYNDTDLSSLLPVPLSSVSLPLSDMGRSAVSMLLSILQDLDYEHQVSFVPRLIVRESSRWARTEAVGQ
jgi:LacI family transcriptional regulator